MTRPAAPAVSHAADGATLVAWSDGDRVRIARWTGAGFAALPDAVGRDGGEVGDPALACDPLGRPVLAFVEDGPGGRVLRVLRHEGSGWADLGAPPVDGPGDASAPKLDVSAGVPCVAWTEARALRVACLNETW